MSKESNQKYKRKNGRTGKTNIIFFIMFVLLTCTDQISKQLAVRYLRGNDISVIPNVLQLHYLENKGAAWGILQNQTWLLIAITVVVLIVIAYIFYKLPEGKKFWLLRFGLVLLAAGALGNFIDRMANHYVIDFIYFSLINFPVFNLADCFVCISAGLILYCVLFKYKDEDFEKATVEKGTDLPKVVQETDKVEKNITAEEELHHGTNQETAGSGM